MDASHDNHYLNIWSVPPVTTRDVGPKIRIILADPMFQIATSIIRHCTRTDEKLSECDWSDAFEFLFKE